MNIQIVLAYISLNQVVIGNGHGLEVKTVGYSKIFSNLVPNFVLNLTDLPYVPTITRNLISVFKFAKDNNVYF